jgi:Tol biopolymer transport system component
LIALPVLAAILIALAVVVATTSWGAGLFPSAGYSYRIAYIGDSPDGRRYLFTVKPDGSGAIQISDVGIAEESFEWSPDGSRIAFTGRGPDNTDIFMVNQDGSNLTDLSEAFPLNPYYPIPYSYLDRDPTWSPDGARIAFARDDNRDGLGVYVMNSDGSDKRLVTEKSLCEHVKHTKWSPVGSSVLFECSRGEGVWKILLVDVDTGELTDVSPDGAHSRDPQWSPDGLQVVFRSDVSGEDEWYMVGSDGTGMRHIFQDGDVAISGEVKWSPDGSKLLFTRRFLEGDDRDKELWTMNVDGSNQTRLTFNDYTDWQAEWSPDGKQIAFYSNRGDKGEWRIVVINANGTGERVVSSGYHDEILPQWSPARLPVPTPVITPTHTPTPATDVATKLPPVSGGGQLPGTMEVAQNWTPDYPGAFGLMAQCQQHGHNYVFVRSHDQVHLLEIGPDGLPHTSGTYIQRPEHIRSMACDGRVLALSSSVEGNPTYLYDISDIRDPSLVNVYWGGLDVLDVEDGRVYIRGDGEEYGLNGPLVIITDIHDLSTVTEFHLFPDAFQVYIWAMDVKGGIAYVSCYGRTLEDPRKAEHFNYLELVDVSDPGAPRSLGRVEAMGSMVRVANGYAYTMSDGIGIQIADVSDPANPRKVGELPGWPPDIGTSTGIREPAGMLCDGDRLYALAWGGDWGVNRWRLLVVDVSDPSKPVETGRIQGSTGACSMWLQGQRVMVVDMYGISVIDVADPGAPRETSRYPAGSAPDSVYLDGQYAFLFLGSGLFVLDLAGPAPRLAAFEDMDPILVVNHEGDVFKVRASRSNGEYQVDLSDPEHPVVEELKDEAVRPEYPPVGSYTYHMTCGKLWVEDAQGGDVTQVRLVESDCSGEWDVAVRDDYAYVVGGGDMYIFDASDPVSPRLVSYAPFVQSSGDVQEYQARIRIEGDHAFVLHRGGLWVLDLSDSESPSVVAYYATDARAIDVDAVGGRIALVNADGSFTLLRYDLVR